MDARPAGRHLLLVIWAFIIFYHELTDHLQIICFLDHMQTLLSEINYFQNICINHGWWMTVLQGWFIFFKNQFDSETSITPSNMCTKIPRSTFAFAENPQEDGWSPLKRKKAALTKLSPGKTNCAQSFRIGFLRPPVLGRSGWLSLAC